MQPTASSSNASSAPTSAAGLTLTLPDPDEPSVRASGAGRFETPVPTRFRALKRPGLTVYVVCAPANATFTVSVSGARKFWGTCSNGPGSVSGGFALRRTDRIVTLDVAPDVQWALAMTRG